MGVTDFVLQGTRPEENPKSEKIGFRKANKAIVSVSPKYCN